MVSSRWSTHPRNRLKALVQFPRGATLDDAASPVFTHSDRSVLFSACIATGGMHDAIVYRRAQLFPDLSAFHSRHKRRSLADTRRSRGSSRVSLEPHTPGLMSLARLIRLDSAFRRATNEHRRETNAGSTRSPPDDGLLEFLV